MANWGDVLKMGDKGDAVRELQIRLAGFRGTVPDGDYGPGTALQVARFQADVMGLAVTSGVFDAVTLAALDAFRIKYGVDFAKLKCPCGTCGGFGKGINKGVYRNGVQAESHHRYEYPGIHRMILWAYRAAQFYAEREGWKLKINSGYRCSIDNKRAGRVTTNHMGKAIDIGFATAMDDKRKRESCNKLRGLLVHHATAQIGWAATDRKALEPASIAPTWVHYDVRSYRQKYLPDAWFVKDVAALDTPLG